MTRYMISFWSPRGDYTAPDTQGHSLEAAVNKAWLKVPKKYRSGMVRAFATDLDSPGLEEPVQLIYTKDRWSETD